MRTMLPLYADTPDVARAPGRLDQGHGVVDPRHANSRDHVASAGLSLGAADVRA